MILVDTDVAIDILRSHAPALSWLQVLGSAPLGLPGLVMMELLQGCHNKGRATPCGAILPKPSPVLANRNRLSTSLTRFCRLPPQP